MEVLKKRRRLFLTNYIKMKTLIISGGNINIKNLKKYCSHYSLPIGKSLEISNEIIEESAIIQFKKGILIVIESKD